jgi:hypothetical protein
MMTSKIVEKKYVSMEKGGANAKPCKKNQLFFFFFWANRSSYFKVTMCPSEGYKLTNTH